jgi:tRNA(adenine34) deaminase
MTDDLLMRQAIAEAHAALVVEEVPIGCVIFHHPTQTIIARAHNRREGDSDPTAHAEILAIRQAAAALADWRLTDCTLAVTVEPCPMCAGAIVNARIARLVYGCPDPKAGAVRTLYRLCDDPRLNHRVEVAADILPQPCAQLLADFFKAQRAAGKK